MATLGWLFAALLALSNIFVWGLWRIGIRDRHHMAQFIFLLLFHPGVFEVQRNNLAKYVQLVPAKNASELGARMLLVLSRHATRIAATSTGVNSEILWEIHKQS
jgi:hypothetical protein